MVTDSEADFFSPDGNRLQMISGFIAVFHMIHNEFAEEISIRGKRNATIGANKVNFQQFVSQSFPLDAIFQNSFVIPRVRTVSIYDGTETSGKNFRRIDIQRNPWILTVAILCRHCLICGAL